MLFAMDPEFPLEDVVEIGRQLTASASLVPGWIPPAAGMLDLGALLVWEHVDGFETVVLADSCAIRRNPPPPVRSAWGNSA